VIGDLARVELFINATRMPLHKISSRGCGRFLGDWYLDTEIGIDWLTLLGNLGTEKRILRSVESTVMQTEGVLSIQELKIIGRDSDRGVTIRIRYTDVFGASNPQTMEFTA